MIAALPLSSALTVPVLRDHEIRSWPKYPLGGRAEYTILVAAFTREFTTDAHFAAYSVPTLERRLGTDAVLKPDARAQLAAGVPMVAVVFDVDCPEAHKGDPSATDAWWIDECEKIAALLAVHIGGFVYRTRGGYRIVYLLAVPIVICVGADAEAWSSLYCAWIAYLLREFEIAADAACRDWTRLYRLPHATRDEGGRPERRETIGDPTAIGMWTCEPTKGDHVAGKALCRKRLKKREADVSPVREPTVASTEGVLLRLFASRGWLGDEIEKGKWTAACPNESAHTKGAPLDGSTVLYAPSAGESFGWLHCSHAHCSARVLRDVLQSFSADEVAAAKGPTPAGASVGCRAETARSGAVDAPDDSPSSTKRPSDSAVAIPGDPTRGGAAMPKRPNVDVTEIDLPVVSGQVWEIVAARNRPPQLFRHAMNLARIREDEEDGVVIQHLEEAPWRYEIARAAKWVTKSAQKQLEAVPPPTVVVRDMLAEPNPPLPVLARVVRAPVFGRDGSLRTNPGYDPTSRCFYVPSPGLVIPTVPERPTAGDVASARLLLRDELLCNFAFTGDAEFAHIVALGLEPFVRELFDGPAPLHLIEKPKAGTGATLLVDVVLLAALGPKIPKITEGRDEDEWRKRLTSKLLNGPQVVIVDNVRRPLDSGQLSSAITASVWEDRILGLTQNARIPVRCSWVATANNPVLSDEMARRAVRTRIDTGTERPWLGRTFRHPLPAWAIENRGDLIWANLVLARAWLAAGRPVAADAPMLGMFEGWSATIGGMLAFAKIPGFLGNLSELYEGVEREEAAWRTFVVGWFVQHGDRAVGVADLFSIADAVDGFDLGDGNDRSRRTKLGVALARFRDRTVAGHRIAFAGDASNASLWRLVNVARGSVDVHANVQPPQPVAAVDVTTEIVGQLNVDEPLPGKSPCAHAHTRTNESRENVHDRSDVQPSVPNDDSIEAAASVAPRTCLGCGRDTRWISAITGDSVCGKCHPPPPGAERAP